MERENPPTDDRDTGERLEVTDPQRKPGMPSRAEMYRRLKERSIELQSGKRSDKE